MTTMCNNDDVTLTAHNFHCGVTEMVQNLNFAEATKSSRALLPMLAFAKIVVDKTLRPKGVNVKDCFNGLVMTVPALQQSHVSPECHSTVGQKLLHVDWKMHDLEIV